MGMFSRFKDGIDDKIEAAKGCFSFLKVFLSIFNTAMFVIYVLTTYLAFKRNDTYPFFQYLTLGALGVYFVVLIVFLIINIAANKKMGMPLKRFMRTNRILKLVLNAFNLLLSVMVVIAASTGDFFSTAMRVFTVVFSSFGFILNILLLVFQMRWEKRKREKAAANVQKPRYVTVTTALKEKTEKSAPSHITAEHKKEKGFDFKKFLRFLVREYDDNEDEQSK
jgi:hypothetical protein